MKLIPEPSSTTRPAGPDFTEGVWRTDFIDGSGPQGLAGSRFDYAPGARSHWHIHEHEQAIIVVHGHGLVLWEGLDGPEALDTGDWWHVEPGVPHWHGATGDSIFGHLAVTAGGATIWLGAVTEEHFLHPPRRD